VSDSKPTVVLPSPTASINVQDLVSEIQELAEQLKVLQGALEEQQQIDTEKDQLIARLTQENELLRKGKTKSALDGEVKESKKVNNYSSEKEKKSMNSFHRRVPPVQRPDRMINAAAQTESPTVKHLFNYM